MSRIAILEDKHLKDIQENSYLFLTKEKFLTEHNFTWLKLYLEPTKIIGSGILQSNLKNYEIILSYSPFNPLRFDRIFVKDETITYNDNIHVYGDMSLCLYHPIKDKPFVSHIPLCRMVPWISEWIFFYEEWQKYNVWLGKEIKHNINSRK